MLLLDVLLPERPLLEQNGQGAVDASLRFARTERRLQSGVSRDANGEFFLFVDHRGQIAVVHRHPYSGPVSIWISRTPCSARQGRARVAAISSTGASPAASCSPARLSKTIIKAKDTFSRIIVVEVSTNRSVPVEMGRHEPAPTLADPPPQICKAFLMRYGEELKKLESPKK